MSIPDHLCRGAILSFMETRCAVSSQHRLPTMDEFLSSVTAQLIGRDRARSQVEELIGVGVLLRYGPYISDHDIEVL